MTAATNEVRAALIVATRQMLEDLCDEARHVSMQAEEAMSYIDEGANDAALGTITPLVRSLEVARTSLDAAAQMLIRARDGGRR